MILHEGSVPLPIASKCLTTTDPYIYMIPTSERVSPLVISTVRIVNSKMITLIHTIYKILHVHPQVTHRIRSSYG